MKPLTSIIIEIKGRPWVFKLLSDRAFDKLHNTEELRAAAMTIPHQYEVHFRKTDWTTICIKHEIFHCLHFASLVSSADLTVADTEELFCEIGAHHLEEILLWSNQVTEKFLNYK